MGGRIGSGHLVKALAVALESNRLRRELAGGQCIVNSLAREWLDYPGRIADEKKRSLACRNGRPPERSDRAPGMVGRNIETRFGPSAQRCNFVGHTDEAKIQLATADRRLAGITFGPKLQHHPVAEL